MSKVSRVFNSWRKRLAAAAIVGLAVALPVAVTAATTVQIAATTGVANVTAGDTTYKPSVNASYNQVVKAEVTYTNTEAPGSGKVANNVTIKIHVPTAPGKTQTITTSTAGSNTNTVNGSAVVNLDRSDAYLQYIPNTAEANLTYTDGSIHHVTAAQDQSLNNVVTSGYVLNNGNPCQSAAVAIEVGVYIPGTKVVKQVELANQTGQWATSNTAQPGDTLKYMITYTNTGNTTANNVIVRDNLPPDMTYVKGSTVITNSNHPSGLHDTTDAVATDGIVIGNYAPGAVGYVVLEAKIAPASSLKCGETTFTNVGIAHPQGTPEYYNTAYTKVNKACQTATYSCQIFSITSDNASRTAKVTGFNTSTTSGATFKDVVIDWGDNSTPLTTNNAVGQTHQYAKVGNYTISTVSHFTVNDQDVTATSDSCNQPVSFTTPGTPTQLPNTGPGAVAGIFAAVTAMGAFAHRLFLSRRLSRDS